jgi:hypothetical protein
MTLDERVAKLEERTEHLLRYAERIEHKIDVLDGKVEKLQANNAYVKASLNVTRKQAVEISIFVVAFWEIVKRVLDFFLKLGF